MKSSALKCANFSSTTCDFTINIQQKRPTINLHRDLDFTLSNWAVQTNSSCPFTVQFSCPDQLKLTFYRPIQLPRPTPADLLPSNSAVQTNSSWPFTVQFNCPDQLKLTLYRPIQLSRPTPADQLYGIILLSVQLSCPDILFVKAFGRTASRPGCFSDRTNKAWRRMAPCVTLVYIYVHREI